MTRLLRLVAQLAFLTALFAVVAAFADWPVYRQIPPGSALVVLTFVHGGDRLAECRTRTAEEMARLPPNMRRAEVCPRGRRPVAVELEVDGRRIYSASLPPSGIAGDGPSRVYQRFVLPAGRHELAVGMRDTARTQGFDHAHRESVTLAPDQLLVIDYRGESDGFIVR